MGWVWWGLATATLLFRTEVITLWCVELSPLLRGPCFSHGIIRVRVRAKLAFWPGGRKFICICTESPHFSLIYVQNGQYVLFFFLYFFLDVELMFWPHREWNTWAIIFVIVRISGCFSNLCTCYFQWKSFIQSHWHLFPPSCNRCVINCEKKNSDYLARIIIEWSTVQWL